MIALAAVLLLWSGQPPACPRLGAPIITYAATVDAAAAKAQRKAEQRGATHLWVRRAWAGEGKGKIEAVAFKCGTDAAKEEAGK